MPRPVVFISYSHDSDEHRERVLGLAARLRQDGLETRLDQQVNGTPEQGWPRWMLDQLDEAAFVLVVCTETYYRRFRGHEEPGRGKGADWEGALITQEIYDKKSRTTKFVPVMLSGGQDSYIPEPLRVHTHYELTSDERYQALYAFLLGQAGVDLGPLGAIRPVSKRTAQPLTFGSPPPDGPIMIGVPHRNPFFTGRKDLLSRLHQQLQTQGTSALAQAAIYGLGGIGKTQTAIEYAHRFGEHYRFILWVVAEEDSAIRAAYLSFARELSLVEDQANLETALLAVKAWLARETGWLLVFDNADNPSLVRPYLPPTRTGGKVLLTSRANSFVRVGIREPFRVETMEPEDAVRFLLERTARVADPAATELAAELGYLPLALEQAAAYIHTLKCGFAEYLTRYRHQGLALLEKGELSTDYTKTVATAWQLSFDSVRKTSPASAELLASAAFLLPDAIPIEIFINGGSALGGLLGLALEGAAEDSLAFWETFEPLERFSLVERVQREAFKLHRLTQKVVIHSFSREDQRAWADRVLKALNAAYPVSEFKNWSLCEKLQPTVRAAIALVRSYELESPEIGRLFNVAGYFAWQRGDHSDAKLFDEISLEIRESVLGAEHSDTISSRSSLAETLSALGEFEDARRLQEKNVVIHSCLVLGIHPRFLTLTHSLDLAAKFDNFTRTWGRTTFDINLGQFLFPNNMANNFWLPELRLRELAPSTALTVRQQQDPTPAALKALASSRYLQEQTLAIQERELGSEHHCTLITRNNLAVVLFRLGDFTGAKKLHERNLEIRERLLGAEHPNTTISTWNLLRTIAELHDPVLETHLADKLRWLLDLQEESIPSADQRIVRRLLLKRLNLT